MKLRAAIIIDNLSITKWQLDALIETYDQLEIVYVLNCIKSKKKES